MRTMPPPPPSLCSITWRCPVPHGDRLAPAITVDATSTEDLSRAVNRHACQHIGIYERLQLKAGRVPGRLATRNEEN